MKDMEEFKEMVNSARFDAQGFMAEILNTNKDWDPAQATYYLTLIEANLRAFRIGVITTTAPPESRQSNIEVQNRLHEKIFKSEYPNYVELIDTILKWKEDNL